MAYWLHEGVKRQVGGRILETTGARVRHGRGFRRGVDLFRGDRHVVGLRIEMVHRPLPADKHGQRKGEHEHEIA